MKEKDALGHALNRYGYTPLHAAAKKGQEEEIKRLLQIEGHRADINVRYQYSNR
ncbi:MAG: ankyrin repeat domain-containing protein [Candidatus Amoebophilus sp.]